MAYSTWNEVVEAVERGDAYCGVLPFENSNAGDVSAVLDLLYAHPGLKMCIRDRSSALKMLKRRSRTKLGRRSFWFVWKPAPKISSACRFLRAS